MTLQEAHIFAEGCNEGVALAVAYLRALAGHPSYPAESTEHLLRLAADIEQFKRYVPKEKAS